MFGKQTGHVDLFKSINNTLNKFQSSNICVDCTSPGILFIRILFRKQSSPFDLYTGVNERDDTSHKDIRFPSIPYRK